MIESYSRAHLVLVPLFLLVEGHLVLVHVAAGGEAPHGGLLPGLALLLLLEEAREVVRNVLTARQHPVHGAGAQTQRGPGLKQVFQEFVTIKD